MIKINTTDFYKKAYNVICVLVALMAFFYILYKIISIDNYSNFKNIFTSFNKFDSLLFVVVIILSTASLFLESIKWKELLANIEKIPFLCSLKQVCFGYFGASLTPFRIGEYASRGLLLNNKKNIPMAFLVGMLGSFVLLLIEMFLGIPTYLLCLQQNINLPDISLCIIIVLVAIGIVSTVPLLIKIEKEKISMLPSKRQIAYVVLLTLCRYFVWVIQFSLLLYICGIKFPFFLYLISIPTYYLFVTVIPSILWTDVAVKGASGIYFFSLFGATSSSIILATTLTWVINTSIPIVLYPLLHHLNKQKQ